MKKYEVTFSTRIENLNMILTTILNNVDVGTTVTTNTATLPEYDNYTYIHVETITTMDELNKITDRIAQYVIVGAYPVSIGYREAVDCKLNFNEWHNFLMNGFNTFTGFVEED